jgi:hypothetical protein
MTPDNEKVLLQSLSALRTALEEQHDFWPHSHKYSYYDEYAKDVNKIIDMFLESI